MSLPPWYRARRRPLAETVLTINLSRASGIGPLVPGLSVIWDMTPLRCATDPSHHVRLTVDTEVRTLRVTRHREHLATIYLAQDSKRIGAPLRAICPTCSRRCYRLYRAWGWFRCGKCLRVTYGSGCGGVSDRAHARMERLENRLYFTEWLQRHRGRRKINAEIARQDELLFPSIFGRLIRSLGC